MQFIETTSSSVQDVLSRQDNRTGGRGQEQGKLRQFLVAMLLCLGLVSLMGTPAQAQFLKQVSGYLLPGNTMTFHSRVPSNSALDTIYQISGTLSISGTLNIQEGAEVVFLPNSRIVDSAGGVINADGFASSTLQRRILFRGQPINQSSVEWGHFLILPGAGRAYFANCRFTNFRKLNTVDKNFLYGTSGPALTNSTAITNLSNGVGGVMTTFSANTYLYDIIVDSSMAIYRGGAFAFLQAPANSYFPNDDGRMALANSQVRRLIIRDTRVLNTDVANNSLWDNRNALGGAIYMSARPGATSANFVTAYLGNRPAPPGTPITAAFPDSLDQILIERCVVQNVNEPVATTGNPPAPTGFVAKGGGIYVGNYTALVTGRITCNTDSAIAGTPGRFADDWAWGGAIAVSSTSVDPMALPIPAPGFDNLPGLKIYKQARFAGNVAGMGGAIHMDFANVTGPNLNIDGENFITNGFGNPVRDSGLIYFLGNIAYNRGGAIYAQHNVFITGYLAPQNIINPGYLQRELRVKFENNVAGIAGGSICLNGEKDPAIVNRRVWHLNNSVDPNDPRVNRPSLSNIVVGGGAEYVGWRDSTFGTEYHGNFVIGGNGGAVLIEQMQGGLTPATAVNRYFAEDGHNVSNVTVAPLPFDPRQLTRFCDNHAYVGADSVALMGRGVGRGGAMYINITNNTNPLLVHDSTFLNRVRMEQNYAFTGSAIYSDNYNLRIVANSTLIANNHATSAVVADVDLVNGQSNPGDKNAGATIWGEFEGPLPALESNSRGNAIYDNIARYIVRLPMSPGVGFGGVDTMRGNFWGETGPDLITKLPLGGLQRTFFIDYFKNACYTNVYEPNRRPSQQYQVDPINTVPDTILMEGRIYDIFDAGTDMKTADYNPRRLAIQEAFSLGIPTDLVTMHRFTRDIFTNDPTYINKIRNPLQTDFKGPHPIGYPLFLQADVALSDTNRDHCARNYTVLYVINTTTNEFVRVNAKEVVQDDTLGGIARYQGRLDFVPDSSAATRNPNGRAKVLYTLALLRPQNMTYGEIQRASMLEDSAALDGRTYVLNPTMVNGISDYVNGADSVCIQGLTGTQRWYAGERYHTLPVRPGDQIAVISRTQLWKYGAAGALSRGLQFVIGDVLPPQFTSDIATISSDVINPNRRFLREDNVYTSDPTDPNANAILFRIGGFDPNNFYDPRFQFDNSRYTQLQFAITGREDTANTRISRWLKDTTLFNQNVGGANGYIRLFGRPHNPDVVPGGEPLTVTVTNFPPNSRSEGGLLGQGLPFGDSLGVDSLKLSMWTFPPYMNCATGFLSDTLCVRSTSTRYTFRIFVQDSVPVFLSSPASACAANLTDSLRYTYDIQTDDEMEDSTAAAEDLNLPANQRWDFRYGRTSYSFVTRPHWMRSIDVSSNQDLHGKGIINIRIPAADVIPEITPIPQINTELNLDTVIAVQVDDGHTGIRTQRFRLPINVEPQITTTSLPNAKEDFDYSFDFRDTSKVNRVRIFDANFGDYHTFKLVYKGTTDTIYRDEHYKAGQQIITGATPTWLKIDPVSGVLYGTPGLNDAPHVTGGNCGGPDVVQVVVTDICGLTAFKTFNLEVDSTNHPTSFARGPRTFCVRNETDFCDTVTVTDLDLERTNCGDNVNVTVISPSGFTATPATLTGGAKTQKVTICGKFSKDEAYFSQNPLIPDTIKVAVDDQHGNLDTIAYAVYVGDKPTFECNITVSNLERNGAADLQELCFGAGRFGTDSTDIRYCEFETPPPAVAAAFDARWELPIGGQLKGQYFDIRRDTAQFTTVTWQVRFQSGNESGNFLYPVKICWKKSCFENTGSFAGQFYLQNPFDASEFSVNMRDGSGPVNTSLYTLEAMGSDSLCLVIRNVGLQNARIVFVPAKSGVQDAPVAKTFALEQNYPNPFNPSTMINFNVAERSNVRIEVFDMKGALIKTLVNEELEQGNYPVMWDGTDASGTVMPSGTYVAKMTAGTFTSSIKMTLKK